MKRKVILNLAISLDGYIAREDGSFDWIAGDEDKSLDTNKKFDFEEFLNSIDTIIMGRKAFEDCPPQTLESFRDKKIFIATTSKLKSESENIQAISGDLSKIVRGLITKFGKDIWIFGGSVMIDELIKNDVIDEFIIGIVPTILGKGRSLFLKNNPTIKLHLDEMSSQEGIVILKYSRRQN